jgi:hypothetical protein
MEIRKGSNQVLTALAFQFNALRDLNVGSNFHAQVTPSGPVTDDPTVTVAALAVGAANSSSLPTAITLVNDVLRVLNTHYADMSAHKSVQTAALALDPLPSTALLATVQTRANALKASYNTGGHVNTANVHHTNDGTNLIAAADATDQTSLNTLLNELKTDVNAHILAGLAGQHIVLTNA